VSGLAAVRNHEAVPLGRLRCVWLARRRADALPGYLGAIATPIAALKVAAISAEYLAATGAMLRMG